MTERRRPGFGDVSGRRDSEKQWPLSGLRGLGRTDIYLDPKYVKQLPLWQLLGV